MSLPKLKQQEGTPSPQALEWHKADENKPREIGKTSRAGWGCSPVVERLPPCTKPWALFPALEAKAKTARWIVSLLGGSRRKRREREGSAPLLVKTTLANIKCHVLPSHTHPALFLYIGRTLNA